MAIRMRRGNEADFDPSKMLPGEWAVSTDTKYVRMCFVPGIVLRMATYETFESDMAEIRKILSECQDIQTAVELIQQNVTNSELVIENYVKETKQYRDEAEQFRNEAFATTPEGYEKLVKNVSDNSVKIDVIIEKAELNIKNNARGENINLTDSAEGKILDFRLYGKSEQNKYIGKNKLKYPYYETTKSVNGIDFTDLGDGRIMANGKATERTAFTLHGRTPNEINDFNLMNGTYILNGCPSGGGNYTYRINFGITKDGLYNELGRDTGEGSTFTAEGDDFDPNSINMGIAIDILAGTTLDNVIFEPMIRPADIVDDNYEPYVGGIPSPSPHYPQEISVSGSDGSVDVKSVAKNLFPYPYTENTHTENGITWTDNGDGTITANGTASAVSQYILFPRNVSGNLTFEKGTYILSGCPSGDGTKYRLNYSTSDNSVFGYEIGSGATLEITDNSIYWGFFATIVSGATVNNLVFKPMIRLANNTDDTYEPYTETSSTIPTPNGLCGIKVSSGGNYTDENGQQWICDEIVKYSDGRGKRIQRIYEYKVENVDAYNAPRAFITLPLEMMMYDSSNNVLSTCNRFKTVKNTGVVTNTDNSCGGQQTNYAFRSDILGFTTEEEWIEWFTENETIIYYVLATPIETDLTADELKVYENLKTFYPVTNVSNNTNCGMSITYIVDTKNYIDNKFAMLETAIYNNI